MFPISRSIRAISRTNPLSVHGLRHRFAESWFAAIDGRLDACAVDSEGGLLLPWLLDQFSRHLHRRDPRVRWPGASLQRVAMSGIAPGNDGPPPFMRRAFAWLPRKHAENPHFHDTSVLSFEALPAEMSPAWQVRFSEFPDYARRHRKRI